MKFLGKQQQASPTSSGIYRSAEITPNREKKQKTNIMICLHDWMKNTNDVILYTSDCCKLTTGT